ncbi:hypothetical protein [Sulfoacidibacillus thermotolerans]|nr:hypothetical protein [Sulfoacidibacillus thermotolerans]
MSSITGCAPKIASPQQQDTTMSARQGAATLLVTLSPSHLLALHPISIRVLLHSNTDTASLLSSVQIKESMPDMSMPVPIVRLTQRESGVFTGTLVFVMAGPWTLTITGMTTTGQFSQPFHVQVQS